MDVIILLFGFFLLIKGADYFVDGSSSFARLLNIPSIIIGLTIVAMGTSAPEAVVSIHASLNGYNDIAISNIIGSNIFNSLIVIGVCAFISQLEIDPDIMKRDLLFQIVCAIVLSIMIFDGYLSKKEGLFFLVILCFYMALMIFHSMQQRQDKKMKEMSLLKSIIYLIIGLFALIIGGRKVVVYACIIAKKIGLSQNIIGLTVISVGTSLPELVTSIVATRKKESGLALGNAVGSNIFNIVFILGMSSFLSPLTVSFESSLDSYIFIGISILLYVFAKTGKRISRHEGLIFIIFYMIYLMYLFL